MRTCRYIFHIFSHSIRYHKIAIFVDSWISHGQPWGNPQWPADIKNSCGKHHQVAIIEEEDISDDDGISEPESEVDVESDIELEEDEVDQLVNMMEWFYVALLRAICSILTCLHIVPFQIQTQVSVSKTHVSQNYAVWVSDRHGLSLRMIWFESQNDVVWVSEWYSLSLRIMCLSLKIMLFESQNDVVWVSEWHGLSLRMTWFESQNDMVWVSEWYGLSLRIMCLSLKIMLFES